MELRSDTDNIQQGIRLFRIICFQELRQIQCKLLNKGIEQSLPGLLPGRIRHLQIRVLAFPLHDEAVAESHMQIRRNGGIFSHRLRRAEVIAA